MAINAYTGLMGSGKSFEVVANVIVPAIKSGRRVVVNVDGISEDKIYEFLIARNKGIDPLKFGKVLHVSDDDIQKPGFFPDEKKPEQQSIVQAGDLVVVDEAWRHWNKDKKISPEHMQFFRMHRHYTHPDTGLSCDLALIFQSIADTHRSVRDVVEVTARTVKIKTLGLARTYRIELYEGGKIIKAARFARKVMKYDKAIFPLYKSYAGGDGKEATVDKRQNVLRNPVIWAVAFGLIVLVVVCLSFLSSFLSGGQIQGVDESKVNNDSIPGKTPAASSPVSPSAPSSPPVSDLRISGEVVLNGERWIVLTDSQGRFRFESPRAFVGRGVMTVGNVEGRRVATWSGVIPSTSQKESLK